MLEWKDKNKTENKSKTVIWRDKSKESDKKREI